jgi:hypothetical protein
MTFLRSTILTGFFLALIACGGDDPAPKGDDDTEETDTETGGATAEPKDGGKTPTTPKPPTGGTVKTDAGTSGTVSSDGGTGTKPDAGKPPISGGVDAGIVKDAGGGGIMIPDIFGPQPTPDAGTAPTGMGKPGAKDGPCKDLMLFCFDPIDMFLFNPSDCLTCNGGKGCQGCALPYAF